MEWGSALGSAPDSALRPGEAKVSPGEVDTAWGDAWLAPQAGHESKLEDRECEWRATREESNWRTAPRPRAGKISSFVYTNRRWASPYKQKNQKGGLKFCPGENCNVWLPLHQFATNSNMYDGMDMYCIQCNNHRRKEQCERRAVTSSFGGSGSRPLVVDSFEQFCFHEDTAVMIEPPDKLKALEVIDDAILDARIHKGLAVTTSAAVIYSKLFDGRRLVCNVTGCPMTPRCFADHHTLEFKQNGRRMDINCTKCSQPK